MSDATRTTIDARLYVRALGAELERLKAEAADTEIVLSRLMEAAGGLDPRLPLPSLVGTVELLREDARTLCAELERLKSCLSRCRCTSCEPVKP